MNQYLAARKTVGLTRLKFARTGLCLVLLALPAEAQQTDAMVGTLSIEQFAVELRELRAELTQVRLDLENARSARLKNEHAAAAKSKQRLEARERSSYEAIASLDRQLSSAELSTEQRNELELVRQESLDVLGRMRQQRIEAEQKESEIAKELRAANLILTFLRDRSKQRKP